jgi:hypothetical protein
MEARRGEGRLKRRTAGIALPLAVALAASPAAALAAKEAITVSKSKVVAATPGSLEASAAKKRKRKKKKGPPAVTTSSQVSFASGSAVLAIANCPSRTHMTGGGFNVSPPFTPPSTGLRSVTSTSHPTGPTGWNASGSAFSTPAAAGSFTTHAQCENNRLGKIAEIISQTTTLAPGNAQTFGFTCPPGTHPLSGGYAGAGTGTFDYGVPPTDLRIIPLQSRRTGPTQWTVQVLNSSSSASATTFTGYAVCERHARGRTISEVSTSTTLFNDARASGDPSCSSAKQHVVSGGFLITPNTLGAVPSTAIDEFQPVGETGWHLGLHELVGRTLPPGSSLQTYAYCAPDNPPKKKKKKRRR